MQADLAFDAVLFDCDGVLVDSEPATFDLLIDDLTRYGLDLPRQEIEARYLGTTIARIFTEARAAGLALPDDWVEDYYARLYRLLAQGTPAIPGAGALLARLDAAGVVYAVGSNGTTDKMRTTLSQHPALWSRLQGRLFSGQELGCPKPDPGLYRHAAAFLGVAPARCCVIEDSPTGARAARAAGMACFGLAHGDDRALRAEGAHIIRALDELPALLGV